MIFLDQISLYNILLIALALIIASIIRIAYDKYHAKQKLKKLNELISVYNISMNTYDDGIIIISEHDEIIFANKEAHRLLHSSTETLSISYLNTEVKIYLPNSKVEYAFLDKIEEKKNIANAYIIINKVSQTVSAAIHPFNLPTEDSSIGYWRILTIKDREQDIKLQEKIEQTGLGQDIQTNLPLKHHLPAKLLSVILNASKNQNDAALGMLGISDYHQLQKLYGFEKIDSIWISLTKNIEREIQGDEFLYHFDHDSFAILFDNMPSKQTIHNRLEQYKVIIKNTLLKEHIKVEILSSLYYITRPYPTTEKVINHCLHDLYSKKDQSSNKDVPALKSALQNTEEVSHKSPRLLEKKDFLEAIENNNFLFFYQPIYELKKGRIIGVEALTRLNHKKDGLLFPDTFLEQAIECDMMTEVTTHLIDSVLSQRRFWSTQTQKEFTTTINLSIADIHSGIFTETLEKKLLEYSISPSSITIDISEEIVEANFKAVFEECYVLNKLGVKLTIDHFGKGSSNLIQISSLPIQAIKMDGSVIDGITTNEEKIRLVSGIISLGKKLGLEVGATFIDSEISKTLLSRVTCDFGQGNYLGKAMPAFEILELLREQ